MRRPRKHVVRLTQGELDNAGCHTRHPPQRDQVAKMQALGWKVFAVNTDGDVTVVCISSEKGNHYSAGVVYPNGLFERTLGRKRGATWNWEFARTKWAEWEAANPGPHYELG